MSKFYIAEKTEIESLQNILNGISSNVLLPGGGILKQYSDTIEYIEESNYGAYSLLGATLITHRDSEITISLTMLLVSNYKASYNPAITFFCSSLGNLIRSMSDNNRLNLSSMRISSIPIAGENENIVIDNSIEETKAFNYLLLSTNGKISIQNSKTSSRCPTLGIDGKKKSGIIQITSWVNI